MHFSSGERPLDFVLKPVVTTMTEAGEMTSSGGGGNDREGNCLKTGKGAK